jgi:hypothetical protein
MVRITWRVPGERGQLDNFDVRDFQRSEFCSSSFDSLVLKLADFNRTVSLSFIAAWASAIFWGILTGLFRKEQKSTRFAKRTKQDRSWSLLSGSTTT